MERKLRPLNLYLAEASRVRAEAAVEDYGRAIKELAMSNIFPGDMLLKNFGVTRHGRVIFYDFDEISLMDTCRFRDFPQARSDEEELASETWFYVGEHDVFPEEFLQFLGMTPSQRRCFTEAHAEVLTADFWRDLKRRHKRAEVIDVFPYPPARRLRSAR